tara:strand:- start:3129 stop:3671 length:543 start_codon:yes stop_codon:yes gene_type:complete
MLNAFIILSILSLLGYVLRIWYKSPLPNEAIIRTGVGGVLAVTGKGIFVLPLLHRASRIDLRTKSFVIEFPETAPLPIKGTNKITLSATVNLKISHDNIAMVAAKHGTRNASSQQYIESLFSPQFDEVIRITGRRFNYESLKSNLDEFNFAIIERCGEVEDLHGFELVALSLSSLTLVDL